MILYFFTFTPKIPPFTPKYVKFRALLTKILVMQKKVDKLGFVKFQLFSFYIVRMVEMCNYLLLENIKKFRNSEKDAFDCIYLEFKGLIELYVRRLGGDDYRQELLLFLIELLHNIDINKFAADNSDGLNRYISVALRNKYIALSKEKQQMILKQISLEEAEPFLPFSTDNYSDIGTALQQLTQKQKIIIIYKYIFNYSDCEIAELLNITSQAVNRLKNRAFKILKNFYFETEADK